MMGLENPVHLLFILVVLLLLFGAKRLPDMGRSLGDGIRGFRDAMSGQPAPAAAIVAAVETTEEPAQAPAA